MSTLQFEYKNTINLYLTQTLIVNKIYTFVVKVGYIADYKRHKYSFLFQKCQIFNVFLQCLCV